MFCPKCSAYLTERELLKTNVKYAPGNVPIEYEARCPRCQVEMGTVSWGQLTVDPALAAALEADKHKQAKPEAKPLIDAPELRSTLRRPTGFDTGAQSRKVCPHCGKALPENF